MQTADFFEINLRGATEDNGAAFQTQRPVRTVTVPSVKRWQTECENLCNKDVRSDTRVEAADGRS